MPDTFGGEWHRPTGKQRHHKDRQQSNSRRQLEDWATYDNQPVTGPGCLLIACLTILAAIAAALSAAVT
ncbi:hypothetical protein [Streptomyces sp. NPDC057257]|uniref:hypothetical protein n=1 Tax=Streptomyces sp. NPDC057257 TaxID=3346071 RepID=UPI00363E3FCC